MFSIKTIRIAIQLRQGTFDGDSNTVTIEGLPTVVSITKQGGEAKNKCSVAIKNIKQETVKQLTTLAFKRLETYKNVLQVSAGSRGANLPVIFVGEINSAVPFIDDRSGELELRIEALSGYYPNLIPTPPTSVQGAVTIDKLMAQFASEASYQYENKGITGSVANCVFIGSPITKAQTLARQVDIDLLIDDGKMTIQPLQAPKEGESPLLSKDTGLLGYPSFSNEGIVCKSIFNENFKVGGYFKLESVLPYASGEWQIVKVEHKLSAYEVSGGDWLTTVTGVLPGGNKNG